MSDVVKALSLVYLAWERFWMVCSVLVCEGGDSKTGKTGMII